MKIKSKVYLSEVIQNKNAHQAASEQYIPVWFIDKDGSAKPGHLTPYDVSKALSRAERNKEDVYPMDRTFLQSVSESLTSFWNMLVFWKK